MPWSTRQLLVLRVIGVVAAAGFVLQLAVQRALRAGVAELRTANRSVPELRRENFALRQLAAEHARLRQDDVELATVRSEALSLRTRIEAAALLPAMEPLPIPRPTMPRAERRFVIASPGIRSRVMPGYPQHLRVTGIGGVVDVALTIDPQGNVADSWIVNPARAEFESAVLAATKTWKYQPARSADEAEEETIVVPITFDPRRGRVSIGRAQPVPVPRTRPSSPPLEWF